jgi:phenylalanyl-tRNA synthetase beta chain
VRIVHPWLCELVRVPGTPEQIAEAISLRGFEVASVEAGPNPVIDFEITANRPDCLSHIGIAREASAIWNLPLQMPDMAMPPAGPPQALEVSIEDPDLCPRYCAQVFEVAVGASPQWLADRLTAAGVRPINNVVDVTNYVMLELGQPMHAFDLERLAGKALVIRRARPGERLRTLDGLERELDTEMLAIADAERASAIGGVMGGHDSETGSTTRLIALESAYFHPPSVRRTSKRLGLRTEASIRFERGADVNAPPVGIARAAALLHQLGAATPRGTLIDHYPAPRTPARIRLRASRIARVLGQEIPSAQIPPILEPLGFEVAADAPTLDRSGSSGAEPGWVVLVPSFRVDVQREADLIEEVGRHYGYDRLPVTFPPLTAAQAAPDPRIARERLVRRILTAAGFSESMTFAFVERQAAGPFCDPGVEPPALANPLSEKFAVLRPSILVGLVDSCAHNRRRERRDIRLFETGSRFISSGENRAVGLAWCGAADGGHWSAPVRAVDFFDAKGVVEQLLDAFGIQAATVPAVRPYLSPERSAAVQTADGERLLGVVGQLLPAVAEARGLPSGEELFVAELDLDAIAALARADDLRVESLPRFPSIARDISILVDETLPAAAVRGTIRSAAPDTLVSTVEFDRYRGKGVPEGRVSLSLRLTFRAPERTLTDHEADQATSAIVEALRSKHNAERR